LSLFYPSTDRLPIQRHTQTDGPSVDQFQLSWRLFYKIRTRSSGPTESFKPYSLTSKKSVNGIRFSPPLVTILIEGRTTSVVGCSCRDIENMPTRGAERGDPDTISILTSGPMIRQAFLA
jgi:hypothetical protein